MQSSSPIVALRRLFPAALVFVLAMTIACAGGGFQVIENEQTGVTVYRLTGVYPDLNRRIGGSYAQIDFGAEMRVETRPTDTLYAIFAAPLTLGGLNAAVGDDLELVIDDDTVTIHCTRVLQTKRAIEMGNPLTGRGQYFLETLRYEIDRSLLGRLALASTVTFSVHSREKSLPGEFTRDNIKRFRAFYEKYIFRSDAS